MKAERVELFRRAAVARSASQARAGWDVAPWRSEAFALHYAAERPFVLACLKRFGVNANEIPDALQEVFIRVLHAGPGIDGVPIRPWLMAFASRVARELQRSHARPAYRELGRPPCPPQPDEVFEQGEAAEIVEAAMAWLSPSQRVVFELSQIHEVSIVEIARALRVSVNTAYSRLSRAREEFGFQVKRMLRDTRAGLPKGAPRRPGTDPSPIVR